MNKRNREVRAQFAAEGNARAHSFGEILTIAEVAQILRMHRNTVYRLIKRGDIPGFKIGVNWRVNEKDLRTVLAHESDGNVSSLKS
jgi:excisionase family DNA binding protein